MRLSVAGIALVVSIVGLVGCGKGQFAKESQADAGIQGVFRYPIVTNPTSLDPHVVQDGDTIDMLQQVFEGLVMWDENSRVAPCLAEKWEISEDGRTYTFTLKKGVKFHSGREVTAEDFKWSFERVTQAKPAKIEPGTRQFVTETAKTYLTDIVGVREKIEGKATEVSGIKVVDPHTLTITIDKPRPYFLGKLTYSAAFVVDKDKVPANLEINSPEEMVGTGPFIVEKYEREQIISMRANPDYHGGKVQLARLERPVIKDAATRLNKYKAGELDLVMLERQDIAAIEKDPELKPQLQFFDRPAIWYIGLNQKVYAPFKDVRVRRAFAMAIDREKIVNSFLGGVNKLANSIIPPKVLGYRESSQALPFNVAEAKKLLAEAGYPDGKGLPAFEIRFREQRPDITIVAEAVANMLNENLGVKVTLQSMEWRAYLEMHSADQVGLFHMRWAADYLDPENFLSTLLAGYGPENHVGYANPEYDALCAAADVELDEAKRLELYAKAEELVINEAPFIPIYFQRDAELISPRVKGLRESAFGHLPHTTVSVSGK